MGKLTAQIEKSSKNLADTLAFVSRVASGGGVLSPECYELWRTRAELHRPLLETRELVPIRDTALLIAKTVTNDENLVDLERSHVRFCGQVMAFAAARHLALATYVTTTWAIYDRVANVCGRLAAIESIGSNPQVHANPKLCEYFFFPRNDKEKTRLHGFSLNVVLPAYAWPTRVSNLIRNWLVHEGLEKGGVPLFASNGITEGFGFHEEAMGYFKEAAEREGATSSVCSLAGDDGFPWYDMDILTIMKNTAVQNRTELNRRFCKTSPSES